MTGKKKNNAPMNYCQPGSLEHFLRLKKRRRVDENLFDTHPRDGVLPVHEQGMNEENDLSSGENLLEENWEDLMPVGEELEEEEPRFEGEEPIYEGEEPIQEKERMEPMREQNPTNAATNDQGTSKTLRGQTMMKEIHRRNIDERVPIILNDRNQPIGPNAKIVSQFSSFLGTLARMSNLCPLDCADWRYMPTKEQLWAYTQKKWLVPDEGKKWVLATINSSWRRHKKIMKDKYYKSYDNDKERVSNRPKGIPKDQFKRFIQLVGDKKYKKMAKKNRRRRKKQDHMHTTGRIGFAIIKNKMQECKEGKEPPTRAEMFIETRKRVAGRAYKNPNSKTQEKIAKMTQPSQENSSVDPYTSEFPDEHPGRVRLEGRAVTKTDLKGIASSSSTSLNGIHVKVPPDLIKSLTASIKEDMEHDLVSKFILKLQAVFPNLDREALASLAVPEDAASRAANGATRSPSSEADNLRRVLEEEP